MIRDWTSLLFPDVSGSEGDSSSSAKSLNQIHEIFAILF